MPRRGKSPGKSSVMSCGVVGYIANFLLRIFVAKETLMHIGFAGLKRTNIDVNALGQICYNLKPGSCIP